MDKMDSQQRLLLSPDSDGGGGGVEGDQAAKDPPDLKTFTQEQVDKFVADRLRKMKVDLSAKDSRINELQTQLSQLQEQVDKLTKKPDPLPDDVQGQINLITERHNREVEGMKNQISDLKKTAEMEASRRKESELDRELDAALVAAGCTNLKVGRRTHRPQCQWDEVEGKWVYELEKGGTVSIQEGIEEELPDAVRRSRASGGGSGANGGDRRISRIVRELEAEEKTLEKLKERAEATKKSQDITAYSRQKRKVAGLKEAATQK
jgi:uncharacterized protein YoxC